MIPGIVSQASSGTSVYSPADFMANSPTALYSLRLLNPAFGGSCIKVRRSSDNTTHDVGFVANELDQADLMSFVGAGSGYIDTWYDQSGNANHAVQATTARQPRIVNTGVLEVFDGHPAIEFIPGGFSNTSFFDTTDWFLVPPFYFMTSAQTILYSAEVDTTSSGFFPAIASTQFTARLGMGVNDTHLPSVQQIATNDETYWDALATGRYDQWFVQAWTTGAGVNTTTGWIDLLTTFNGSNGARKMSTTFTGAASISRIGGKSFRGHLRDFIVYPSELSTEARKALEHDLCYNVGEVARHSYATASDAYGVAGLKSVCALRKVVPEYTGPCLMIRREDTGALKDIGFDGSGNLDTADILAFGGATVSVVLWYDQSQHGNGWTLRSTSTGPLIVESSAINTIDGTRPALRHTGTTRQFHSGYSPQGGPWTFVTVCNPTDANYKVLYGLAVSANAMSFGFNSANPPALDIMRNGAADSNNGVTVALNSKHVVGFRNSSSFTSGTMTVTPFLDGPDRTNLSLGSFGSARFQSAWLGKSASNTDAFGGKIAEAVVVDRALNSTDTYLIENSMGTRFGITIT